MAKKLKTETADFQSMVSVKFRTTPVRSTMKRVRGLPQSAILYKCPASAYWQFRVFLERKPRKRSTKQAEFPKAEREAKLIYADMLASINSGETKAEPTTHKTLEHVAKSLWAKNETRIKNRELHKDKVSKDKYVFEKHVKPFFARYDVKNIDADVLEQFKSYLADKDLGPATQLSYIQLVMSLLTQAHVKRYISHVPPKPKVRVDDEARGYFNQQEFNLLIGAALQERGTVYDFKSKDGKVYRRTRITEDLIELIEFMVQTYIRPTDIVVLKHRHVHKVRRHGIDFIELRHPATKRHRNHMLGTEVALNRYQSIVERRGQKGMAIQDDFLFLPDMANRDSALDALATQFTALLEITNLRQDAEGKPRTLYSLRHTAIVRSIQKGLPLEMIAANSRTSSEMIRRFYGSHVKSVLYMGSHFVDKEKSIRDERYSMVNALAKEIGFEFDAYEEDETDAESERMREAADRKDDSISYKGRE